MRWITAIGLAGVVLAGCGQTNNEDALGDEVETAERETVATTPEGTGEQPQDAGSDDAPPTGDEPSNGDRSANDDGASDDGDDPANNTLPPADQGLRFVGLWASEAANCDTLAWRFTATRLQTPAGSVCTFKDVNSVPGGYDIAATCTAEAPPAEDTLEIRFAESAQAMLFESDSIADAGLVWCGRE